LIKSAAKENKTLAAQAFLCRRFVTGSWTISAM
jgi:hypothetical protein